MAKQKLSAKTGSEMVAASQARVIDQGGTRFPNVMLDPEQAAMWRTVLDRFGGPDKRGATKEALVYLLELGAQQNEPDPPAELRRLAAYLEGKGK